MGTDAEEANRKMVDRYRRGENDLSHRLHWTRSNTVRFAATRSEAWGPSARRCPLRRCGLLRWKGFSPEPNLAASVRPFATGC